MVWSCGAPWFKSGKSLLTPIRGGHKERERDLEEDWKKICKVEQK